MARHGLLPPVFSKGRTPGSKTPYVGGSHPDGSVRGARCRLRQHRRGGGPHQHRTLFAFVLVSVGVIVLRKQEPDRHRPFRVPGVPFTAVHLGRSL